MGDVRQLAEPELLGTMRADLGEGPVWDPRTGRLLWVDLTGRRILATDPRDGTTSARTLPSAVGAIALRAAGGLVAALEDGFWLVPDEGEPERIAAVDADDHGLRFNDGGCDPQGRFWAGTMAWDTVPGAGRLYRLDVDRSVTPVLDDVSISNGIGWSPDGARMVYVDSPTLRIDAFDFDGTGGTLSGRRTLATVPDGAGMPDGLAIDEEGGAWVAMWGGSCVRRYLPDGTLDAILPLPVAHVSSCAFGGDDLDELFVTSAREGLSSGERRAQPLAGRLFRARVGVRGLARAMYAG